MKPLLVALFLASVSTSGCFGLGVRDCFAAGEGVMVKVEIDPSTARSGGTPPPSGAGAFVLLHIEGDPDSNAGAEVGHGKTDSNGCLLFDVPGTADAPAGSYKVEASINRGPCDWYDESRFEYDGHAYEVTLTLTCNLAN